MKNWKNWESVKSVEALGYTVHWVGGLRFEIWDRNALVIEVMGEAGLQQFIGKDIKRR